MRSAPSRAANSKSARSRSTTRTARADLVAGARAGARVGKSEIRAYRPARPGAAILRPRSWRLMRGPSLRRRRRRRLLRAILQDRRHALPAGRRRGRDRARRRGRRVVAGAARPCRRDCRRRWRGRRRLGLAHGPTGLARAACRVRRSACSARCSAARPCAVRSRRVSSACSKRTACSSRMTSRGAAPHSPRGTAGCRCRRRRRQSCCCAWMSSGSGSVRAVSRGGRPGGILASVGGTTAARRSALARWPHRRADRHLRRPQSYRNQGAPDAAIETGPAPHGARRVGQERASSSRSSAAAAGPARRQPRSARGPGAPSPGRPVPAPRRRRLARPCSSATAPGLAVAARGAPAACRHVSRHRHLGRQHRPVVDGHAVGGRPADPPASGGTGGAGCWRSWPTPRSSAAGRRCCARPAWRSSGLPPPCSTSAARR